MPKNRMISEMGADMPIKDFNEKLRQRYMMENAEQGFNAMPEEVPGQVMNFDMPSRNQGDLK